MRDALPLPCLLLILFSLLSQSAAAQEAQAEPSAAAQQAATETGTRPTLRELQQQLNEADDPAEQERIRDLIKKRNEARNAEQAAKEIPTLSEDPTREECRAFVIAMRDVFIKDPFGINQFTLLGKIPNEHLDAILLEAYDDNSPFKGYWSYKNYTYKDMEPAKANVISHLEEQPRIIQAITFYGWVEDVREQIITKINRDSPNVDFDWFEAAVELNEPTLYPKLNDIAINADDARGMIDLLKTLPDYDLNSTIIAHWEVTRKDEYDFRMRKIAPVAAAVGSQTALAFMIEDLAGNRLYPRAGLSNSINQDRLAILNLIDFRGTTAQIVAWHETNKDNIVFDYQINRFIVLEDF